MTTYAPASLSVRTIAAPIPDEAPVTTATFPSISDIGGLLCFGRFPIARVLAAMVGGSSIDGYHSVKSR
jgi:hypothetical protein